MSEKRVDEEGERAGGQGDLGPCIAVSEDGYVIVVLKVADCLCMCL